MCKMSIITTFSLDEVSSAAEFWYDGKQISSWFGTVLNNAIPPSIQKNITSDQIWRNPYLQNNDNCILAGTIGPTTEPNNSDYDESRYEIYESNAPFYAGVYDPKSYPANARISAIIPIFIPFQSNFGKTNSVTLSLKIRRGLNMPQNNSESANNYNYLLKRCCYGPKILTLRSHFSKEYTRSTIQNEAGALSGFSSELLHFRPDIENNIEDYIPAYNEGFLTYTINLPSDFVPGVQYYLYLWGYDANFSNLIEINLSQSLITLEYEESVTWIYKDNNKLKSTPHVFYNEKWRSLQPYIYLNGEWKRCT